MSLSDSLLPCQLRFDSVHALGHVHQTIEYEYIAKLRREVKANSTGYGTPNGNFINVGCMMPYMDYMPRTLDEIIEGDARYHEENPDAL